MTQLFTQLCDETTDDSRLIELVSILYTLYVCIVCVYCQYDMDALVL